MLAWIDCETTGLDPDRDALLEVALVVTDNELNEFAGTQLVLPFKYDPVDPACAGIHPRVVEMHTKSGLWAECARVHEQGVPTADECEVHLTRTLRQYVEPGTTPMCGATIGFDRAFLRRHMPRLEKLFHYRNVDVSSIGELAARWYPAEHAKRPRAAAAHRAHADVQESIAQLRYWRRHLMLPLAVPW